jgi:hypothetical protein
MIDGEGVLLVFSVRRESGAVTALTGFSVRRESGAVTAFETPDALVRSGIPSVFALAAAMC